MNLLLLISSLFFASFSSAQQSQVSNAVSSLSASISVGGVNYAWPAAQGAANTTLENDGSGNLAWVNTSSAAATANLSGTFTTTTLGICIATVTLTVPLYITQVEVQFHGAMSNGTLADTIVLGILVDSGFVNGESSSLGLTSMKEQVAANDNNMSFSTLVTGLSAGQHNFCLFGAVNAGTATIESTNAAARLEAYVVP